MGEWRRGTLSEPRREGASRRGREGGSWGARARSIDSDRVPKSCAYAPRVSSGHRGAVGTPATGWQLMPFSDLRRAAALARPAAPMSIPVLLHTCLHMQTKRNKKQNNPLASPGFGVTALGGGGGVRRRRGAGGRGFWCQAGSEGRAGASGPTSPPASESFGVSRAALGLVCSWNAQSRNEVWRQLVWGPWAQAGTV